MLLMISKSILDWDIYIVSTIILKLYIDCPITNKMKPFPSHIKLDQRTKITGSILSEHVKIFDLSKRYAKFKEAWPSDIFSNVIEMIEAFFYKKIKAMSWSHSQ